MISTKSEAKGLLRKKYINRLQVWTHLTTDGLIRSSQDERGDTTLEKWKSAQLRQLLAKSLTTEGSNNGSSA